MLNPEHRKYICEVWNLPEEEMPQAGVSVVEMFNKMRESEIRGDMSSAPKFCAIWDCGVELFMRNLTGYNTKSGGWRSVRLIEGS